MLLPLEKYLLDHTLDGSKFPNNYKGYYERYKNIKSYLEENVYPLIHAGTSSEDGGIYTDHSVKHFDYVISYLGKLIHIDHAKAALSPYEVYVALVAILIHDAGNVFGREKHEEQTYNILKDLGSIAPDNFENRLIAKIARAHGGKVNLKGVDSKDTISSLREEDSLGGIKIRSQLIAALVRFADEICEDRSRAASYLMDKLPKFSEIYHMYAYSISSVDVDIPSKQISIKYELEKKNVVQKFGKGNSKNINDVYLIDEINLRLEKMFTELIYCRNYMHDVCNLSKIRADVIIYDDSNPIEIKSNSFELGQKGYPSNIFKFSKEYPNWNGEEIYQELVDKDKAIMEK